MPFVMSRADGHYEETARGLRLVGGARSHHPLGPAELQRRLLDLPASRARRLVRHLRQQDGRRHRHHHRTVDGEPAEQNRQRALAIRR